ncbi:MAG: SDR family oxidoreductase [Kofleriaceae bacterium]|nr:SDR family oxidoreductase [Kofleriaceae bacterium]MBP6837294.1 SDR family oxidoreductase [Kofleriaceae bacterium]MBP9202675.1 SDR family oxidoreductase [Kofleriaceae bacterium]
MSPPVGLRLDGRRYIVTGANTGIGKVTALELARAGAQVDLACRSAAKTAPVVDEIKRVTGNDAVRFYPIDLTDLGSVRACADALLAEPTPIHTLINNAGMAGLRGQTAAGFELAFAANHLGHYLLTRLLLPRLTAAAPARVVNVSSRSHYQAKGIDWAALRQPSKSYTGMTEYAVSKLCNVLFAKELARRTEGTGVTTYALHPGVIASDIWGRRMPRPLAWLATRFMITTEQGALTTLHCATALELAGASGRYYDDRKEKRPSRLADDAALATELWTRSAEWVGLPA